MELNILRNGYLNSDVDVNLLEGGDYPNAINIVKETGVNGGGGTLRVYESIKELPIVPINKTFVKAVKQGNEIFELYKDSTDAFVYRLSSLNVAFRELLFSYPHSIVDANFIPDIEIIDNYLVWNYHGNGTLLYWNVDRVAGTSQSVFSLLMSKPAPIGLFTVEKNKSTGFGVGVLENNEVQFSARYKFDTGEYSVLGPYTEMFSAEKDTVSYNISINITAQTPSFAKEIDIYVRYGESGTWRRILTQKIPVTIPSTIVNVWKGDLFETLATKYSAISFSAIPAKVGSIVAANNRIFLGNFQDDYENDAVGTLAITPNAGYTLPGGGNIETYLGADTTDVGIKSSENGTYYKPFANNSLYSVGVAFFDEAMKTTGVQFVSNFTTGMFSYPIAPSFSLTQSGGSAKPSFAKYMQLCMTKNLTKGYIFEGYANSIYFELSFENTDTATGVTTTGTRNALSVKANDISKVTSMVVDISGLFGGNNIYVFNEGDRITINTPGETEGTYRILDLKVKYSDGDKVYCNWTGGLCSNDAIPNATMLHFEIYSPKQQTEEDNLLFYAIGDVIDVSSAIPATITNYHLGDAVFKKVSFAQYTETYLNKAKIPTVPAVITQGQVSSVVNRKLNTDTNQIAIANTNNDFSGTVDFSVPMNEIGANPDGMTLSSGEIVIGSFYDNKIRFTCQTAFDYVYSGSSQIDTITRYEVQARLMRSAYDQYKGTYSEYEQIGDRKTVYSHEVDPSGSATTPSKEEYFVFDVSLTPIKINALDKIKVLFTATLATSNFENVSFEIKQKAGVDYSLIMTIVGDQIATEVGYYPKPKVAVGGTKTSFVVREMQGFSGGKAYLKANGSFTKDRTNAIRHGGNMVPGTDVNDLSLFFALDTVEVPIGNGEIMSLQRASRLQGDGDMLLAICKNEASYLLLGEYQLQNSDNSGIQTLASNIIGTIRNLGTRTGMQERSSFINYDGDIYWWDEANGYVVEYTKQGLRIVSDIKNKSRFLNRKGSGFARFGVDPFYKMVFVKVGTTNWVGFSMKDRQWVSEYEISSFSQAIPYGDRCLYYHGGNKLSRTLENAIGNKYGEYFGVSNTDAEIDLVANTVLPIMPKFLRIDHTSNFVDHSQINGIKLNSLRVDISNENQQSTKLLSGNFNLENNKLYSHILRDENSSGGIINGNEIQGYSNIFKVSLLDKTQDMRIFGVNIDADVVSGH